MSTGLTPPEIVGRRDLLAAEDATWRFVAFHHPASTRRVSTTAQRMRLLAPIFEAGKVDIVFNGHVHNYQRSLPLKFVPYQARDSPHGGNRDNKTVRGRLVNGRWQLDKSFDGNTTKPNGRHLSGHRRRGQHLYNPEQTDDPDSWQKFTDKFFSAAHSLTVADVDGKIDHGSAGRRGREEVDRFSVTK